MNVKLPKTVNELYTLADKCARAEEGRPLLGEEAGVEVDSDDDDDAPGPKGRNQKRSKKRKGKSVLAVEGSGDLSTGKKAKDETPSNGAASCADCREAASEKTGKSNAPYCKNHRTKGHDLQECRQVEQLAENQKAEYEKRDKEKGQDGATGNGRGDRGGRRDKAPWQKEKPARDREYKEEDNMSDYEDYGEDSSDKEFQRATKVMCVDGGCILAFLSSPAQTVGVRS
ncbi:hypothetical protein ZWY2020_006517 [Hordeum vulgare]|nr:hypothetical protein ZWY2020_006517 [Hordeum vulgare]